MELRVIKNVTDNEWNKLVVDTYSRPYNLQQQNGCMDRQTIEIEVPSEATNDSKMHKELPYRECSEVMGVQFETWLKADPEVQVGEYDWETELWWQRNFYPDLRTVANDLYERGLIEEGIYSIKIDW